MKVSSVIVGEFFETLASLFGFRTVQMQAAHADLLTSTAQLEFHHRDTLFGVFEQTAHALVGVEFGAPTDHTSLGDDNHVRATVHADRARYLFATI